MVVLTNLTVIPLLAGIYFFEKSILKLAAGLGVLLAFEALAFLIRRMKPRWNGVKPLAYYFLPTAPVLWVLSKGRRRPKRKAQMQPQRAEAIIATWPDTSLRLITDVLDPEQQQGSLSRLLNEMDAMRDSRRATVTDRIRQYLTEILKSVRENGNYPLFGQVMSRLSLYRPERCRETYRSFLRLLTEVFDPPAKADPGSQFRKDMTGPLKHAIEHAGKAHASRIQDIVARIMAGDENEHDSAASIAEMLPQLDWTEQREICRIIFDESARRALRCPQPFGMSFLSILSKLEHRVFWLDMQSLRSLVEDSLKEAPQGVISSNPIIYHELCSKVLSPLEDPARNGICHGRVFRRLKHDDGSMSIECVGPDGSACRCQGESLSFRGIYSKDCRKGVGEKLTMNMIPIREVGRRFAVKASIAPLHAYESGTQGPGRGVFFEDAEPSVVKGLYEYVSTKQ